MTLKTYKCPNCGADIEVNADFDDATCNYCRTTFKLEEESTAKYAINKVAGIANKILDNREAAKIRAEEEKKRAEENALKNTFKVFIAMIPLFIMMILFFIMAIVGKQFGL